VLASGSVQLPRFTLLESGSLLISPSHISDAGTYTCMASNSRGIDEASADLVVWGEREGLFFVLFFFFLDTHAFILSVVNAEQSFAIGGGGGVLLSGTSAQQRLGKEVVRDNKTLDTKEPFRASLESSSRLFLQEATMKKNTKNSSMSFQLK